MVEAQKGLGHGSEDSPRKDLTTADKLVLAYNARQDFARAIAIADIIPGDYPRVSSYKSIGSAFARSGIDPSPILKRLHNYVDIARIQAEAGDFEAAGHTMAMGVGNKEWDTGYVIGVAKMKAAAGIDPMIEVTHIKFSIREHENKSPICPFKMYEDLAMIEYQAGKDPSPSLTHAEEKLDELAQKYPDFSGTAFDYSELAKAYAICGNFERALAVVDKIKHNPVIEAELKMKTLVRVAEEQIARGHYQDAVVNAQLAAQTIEYVMFVPEHLKSHLKNSQAIEVAKIYAIIAKAQGLNGEDPSSSFVLAVEKVGEISFEGWGAQSLIEIAKAQAALGIDPVAVLDLARKGLDGISQRKYYDEWDLDYRQMAYKDLAIVQAELGEIDGAKETLSHLERMDVKGNDNKNEVSETLAGIAEVEARIGLSSEEINGLSQEGLPKEEIQAILVGDNEIAKEAVVYFGLDKKAI